jgi:hypothetical protein
MAERTRVLNEQGAWINADDPLARRGHMRRFLLNRTEDTSGVSGTGVVAEGIAFTDGTVVLRWTVQFKSTAVYESVEDLIAIHGHEGTTEVAWLDH